MALYFDLKNCPDTALPLSSHRKWMEEEGLKTLTLHKAKPYKMQQEIWCEIYGMSERGECGRACSTYMPRNGKSGMCKNQGRFYEPTDETITLTL